MFNLRPRGHDLSLPSVKKVLACFCFFHWHLLLFNTYCLCHFIAMRVFVGLHVIQCGCHWSLLKAITFLLTYIGWIDGSVLLLKLSLLGSLVFPPIVSYVKCQGQFLVDRWCKWHLGNFKWKLVWRVATKRQRLFLSTRRYANCKAMYGHHSLPLLIQTSVVHRNQQITSCKTTRCHSAHQAIRAHRRYFIFAKSTGMPILLLRALAAKWLISGWWWSVITAWTATELPTSLFLVCSCWAELYRHTWSGL